VVVRSTAMERSSTAAVSLRTPATSWARERFARQPAKVHQRATPRSSWTRVVVSAVAHRCADRSPARVLLALSLRVVGVGVGDRLADLADELDPGLDGELRHGGRRP